MPDIAKALPFSLGYEKYAKYLLTVTIIGLWKISITNNIIPMIDNLTNISQKGILTIFFSNEKGSLPMIICPENRHISQARLPLLKSVENLTISGDGNYLPGNELTRSLKGNFCSMLKTTATGNFHTNNGYRLDIVIRNNLCQFIGIV